MTSHLKETMPMSVHFSNQFLIFKIGTAFCYEYFKKQKPQCKEKLARKVVTKFGMF